MLVRWSTGMLVRWSTGMLVRWSTRMLVRWSTGMLLRWSTGMILRWSTGMLLRWSTGMLLRWSTRKQSLSQVQIHHQSSTRWHQTPASALRDRQLSTWDMAEPLSLLRLLSCISFTQGFWWYTLINLRLFKLTFSKEKQIIFMTLFYWY